MRQRTPLEAHAEFMREGRDDPVDLLESQAATRVPELVPIRYGRMLTSPFAFYRGAALVMAADLARTPSSGLRAQLSGDAHMSNFGVFNSPERRLVFDLNDFDETSPGPFEWDVKRLAASLSVAGRVNGYSRKKRHKIARAATAGYREAMLGFAGMGNLAVWYTHVDMDELVSEIRDQLDAARGKRAQKQLAKFRSNDSVHALAKLTTQVDGRARIVSQPPLIVPIEELFPEEVVKKIHDRTAALIRTYRQTLQRDRRHLLEQFKLVQIARKVVGVGSVGTRAWILLFEGLHSGDPLFLQAKEAAPSVLSGFVEKDGFTNHGERVVVGQRLMQATSDIFLGWEKGIGPDGVERHFYVRQLRDGKGSAEVERLAPDGMAFYGRLCGQTLARAHARSGDRVAIAAYLGSSNRFDHAIADFAEQYAEQNVLDHAALAEAAATGRVSAQSGV